MTTFTETSVRELWRLRQQAKEEEDRARKARQPVEKEIFARLETAGASRLSIGDGLYVDRKDGTTWAYTPAGVEALRQYLVGGEHITEAEWYAGVNYDPRVNGNHVRSWGKLGDEAKALIDAARAARKGAVGLDGPTLKEMGE